MKAATMEEPAAQDHEPVSLTSWACANAGFYQRHPARGTVTSKLEERVVRDGVLREANLHIT